jgi:DNA-binding LytR/AlgR family response regulator
MDIQVPGMSGMETAKRIREKDGNVIIVFVTNLSQYAIKGYEVNAFDFILKPIDYNGFSMKLNRILTEYSHLHENYYVNIKNKEGVVRIPLEDLLYIEVVSHNIVFHKSDEEITIRGVLKDYVDDLSKHYFCLCNKGYLVNLAHVRKVDKIFAFMSDGTKLLISKGKRKEFLEELNKYLGGTI